MAPLLFNANIEAHGCSISLRRVAGPAATELYLHCRPPAHAADVRVQADAIYRALLAALEAEGGSYASVAVETIFLRSLPASLPTVRAARERVVSEQESARAHRPAVTEIEQPPLDAAAWLEVMVQAVLPRQSSTVQFDSIAARSDCTCPECAHSQGVLVRVADEARFHAGGLCGSGRNAHEQTLAMFDVAETLLQRAGMEFSDVVRTWIYLRHMERDYPQLNRARREFFAARGIQPVPASTGIQGGPPSPAHDLCLGIHAVKAGRPMLRTVMTSPTLNEAAEYGADFVRGMKVVEANKIALHVSGTASIDEQGRSAHIDNFDAQAERMLVNIAALLERQGANYGSVVSAITYLKRAEDAAALRRKLSAAGFAGFPHALVVAEICRPELLCETEALAVLPTKPS